MLTYEQIHFEPEGTPSLREIIRLRLQDQALFNSEQDRTVAATMLTNLERRFDRDEISIDTYIQALYGLETIIPSQNEHGLRTIADIAISPAMERVINSRLDSPEVNMTEPGGVWADIPEPVLLAVIMNSPLNIEMTDACTVRCDFCPTSNKGPITGKLSLTGIRHLLLAYRQSRSYSDTHYVSDVLYWNSDPFDAKWKQEDGSTRTYLDVARLYWQIMQDFRVSLFTSTSIPVGEELQVLAFADEFLTNYRKKAISPNSKFRISFTDANTIRTLALQDILLGLHDNPFEGDHIIISDNRNEYTSKKGPGWFEESAAFDLWDIIGPDCREGVVIGVNRIDGVIMEASSNERPNGGSRFPIMSVESNGKNTYIIPHYQQAADHLAIAARMKTGFSQIKFAINKRYPAELVDDFISIYPESTYTRFTENYGNLERDIFSDTENVHKAALRIAGLLEVLTINHNGYMLKITRAEKQMVRDFLSCEISILLRNEAEGSQNVTVNYLLEYLRQMAII